MNKVETFPGTQFPLYQKFIIKKTKTTDEKGNFASTALALFSLRMFCILSSLLLKQKYRFSVIKLTEKKGKGQ